jgi:hypothetical protein
MDEREDERMSDRVSVPLSPLPTSRYASGGVVNRPDSPDDDRIPAVLSSCLHTQLRPGETHAQAMARLMEGEDL